MFFAHIPRTGGTSLLTWLGTQLSEDEMYPSGKHFSDVLIDKMLPSGLQRLGRDQIAKTRLYAPHLPLAASELLGLDIELATLVRDPVDQLRSVLDMRTHGSGLSLGHIANPWYTTHQLSWYLGASAEDVVDVYAEVDLADLSSLDRALRKVLANRDLTSAAVDRLADVRFLGISSDPGRLWLEIANHLKVAAPPSDRRVNRGRGTDFTPEQRQQAIELLSADLEIFVEIKRRLRIEGR